MSQRTKMAAFIDAERPSCGPNKRWNDLRGKPCEVFVPPEKPMSPSFVACGTRFVWRVSPEQLRALGIQPPSVGHYCVCEHMIRFPKTVRHPTPRRCR